MITKKNVHKKGAVLIVTLIFCGSLLLISPSIFSKENQEFESLETQSISTDKSTVYLNNPPEPPIIDGPTSGEIKKTYSYQVTLIEPDLSDFMFNLEMDFGQGVEYYDCGCDQSWRNGTVVDVFHSWDEPGDFAITARVQDEHGAWSDWSEPFMVSMPKSKRESLSLQQIFLNNILDRFPILSSFLYE